MRPAPVSPSPAAAGGGQRPNEIDVRIGLADEFHMGKRVGAVAETIISGGEDEGYGLVIQPCGEPERRFLVQHQVEDRGIECG